MTGFLTPEDEWIEVDYFHLQNFCKEICQRTENQEAFFQFAKDYKNFSPYFDFVVFYLKYAFVGPLLNDNLILAHRNGSLIALEISDLVDMYGTIKYRTILNALQDRYYLAQLPYINPCSNSELKCRPISSKRFYSSVITDQGVMMMSTTGFDQRGSHGVTNMTITNMLLIENPMLISDFQSCLQEGGTCNDFLLENLGYLHFVSKKEGGLILYGGENHSPIIDQFLLDRKNEGYFEKDITKRKKERSA